VAEELCVFNLTRQTFLSLGVGVADSHIARLRGLLGRARLRSGQGLWVVPCQGIHTLGLRFPIDVVYLDADFRVLNVIEHLSPFRIAPLRRRSASVLELPTRTVCWSDTKVGDQFLICSPEELAEYWSTRRVQDLAG
jgi:uncharacterized protein